MAKPTSENLSIKLESKEYNQLSLNEKIRVFNAQVHQFEDTENQLIQKILGELREYILSGKLIRATEQELQRSLDQAYVNLEGLRHAETVSEAELYTKTFKHSLQSLLSLEHRRRFIMLQSDSIELAFNATKVKQRQHATEKELQLLEGLYGEKYKSLFEEAKRTLKLLAESENVAQFAERKKSYLNALAEIHEQANRLSATEKAMDELVEEAIKRSERIFNARSSYLEDDRSRVNRMLDFVEKGWTGLGFSLAIVSLVLIIVPIVVVGTAVAAPIIGTVAGIAGAIYGVVDLSRTISDTVLNETTVKLGEREVAKPEKLTNDKFKQLAIKSAPIVLGLVGAGLAIAAVFATGGLAAPAVLSVAGVLAAGIGVGLLVSSKYKERKKIKQVREKHAEINRKFEPTEESTDKNKPELSPQLDDSIKESMSLLRGEAPTPKSLQSLQENLQQEEKKEQKLQESTLNQKILPPPPQTNFPSTSPSKKNINENEEEEEEGENEGNKPQL